MIKFSVVVPAYNGERFIESALRSVLRQSYLPLEIIVVDDGSTDRTVEVVKRFPPPVRLIQRANGGVAAARNSGAHHATGDWIALLDQDDQFFPDKLKRQAEVIEADPKLVLVYSGIRTRAEDGTSKDRLAHPPSRLWPTLRYRSLIVPSTAVIKREALAKLGGFDESLCMADDWDLWLRLVRAYSPSAFGAVSEPQSEYRLWEGNHSRKILKLLNETERVAESAISDLCGLSKHLWRQRILARAHFEAAVELRAQSDPAYRSLLFRSLVEWPLCGKVVPAYRYKVLLHTLVSYLG